MEQAKKDTGLSPEQIERIKAAQKKHAAVDPGCENLTPEEFINWHPVGGISWEERSRRMKAAGLTDPEQTTVEELVKSNTSKEMLKFIDSGVWEGNLKEMRTMR